MTEHHDRDTVVVSDSGGSGMGMILGVLLIIALLVAVWYFTLGPGTTPRSDGGANPPAVPSLPAPSM
jgi:hypothetical protein